MSIVAENVKRILKERGIKGSFVAQKVGLTPNQFSSMLHGRRTIRADDIQRLCIALAVTPNDLFENKLT